MAPPIASGPDGSEVTEDAREFLAFLTREVRKAQETGELDPSVEAE
jgi:hypothetical protein